MILTLDTSVFLRFIEKAAGTEIIQKLFDSAIAGGVEISATTLAEAEIEIFTEVLKYKDLLTSYKIREIDVVNNSLVLNFKSLTEAEATRLAQIKKCLHPDRTERSYQTDNKSNDADHLFAHWRSGHDCFVTLDGKIIAKRAELGEIGIKVATPSEIIAVLQ